MLAEPGAFCRVSLEQPDCAKVPDDPGCVEARKAKEALDKASAIFGVMTGTQRQEDRPAQAPETSNTPPAAEERQPASTTKSAEEAARRAEVERDRLAREKKEAALAAEEAARRAEAERDRLAREKKEAALAAEEAARRAEVERLRLAREKEKAEAAKAELQQEAAKYRALIDEMAAQKSAKWGYPDTETMLRVIGLVDYYEELVGYTDSADRIRGEVMWRKRLRQWDEFASGVILSCATTERRNQRLQNIHWFTENRDRNIFLPNYASSLQQKELIGQVAAMPAAFAKERLKELSRKGDVRFVYAFTEASSESGSLWLTVEGPDHKRLDVPGAATRCLNRETLEYTGKPRMAPCSRLSEPAFRKKFERLTQKNVEMNRRLEQYYAGKTDADLMADGMVNVNGEAVPRGVAKITSDYNDPNLFMYASHVAPSKCDVLSPADDRFADKLSLIDTYADAMRAFHREYRAALKARVSNAEKAQEGRAKF